MPSGAGESSSQNEVALPDPAAQQMTTLRA